MEQGKEEKPEPKKIPKKGNLNAKSLLKGAVLHRMFKTKPLKKPLNDQEKAKLN